VVFVRKTNFIDPYARWSHVCRHLVCESLDIPAITTIIKAVASGDTRAAIAMLKGIGIFAAQSPGATDPAILRREMELDRRQQRIDLAARSSNVASDERNHFYHEVCEAERAESRRSQEEQNKRAEAEAAERRSKGKGIDTDPKMTRTP
jgi:hypothetical protein